MSKRSQQRYICIGLPTACQEGGYDMTVANTHSPLKHDSEDMARIESRIRRELFSVAYPCLRRIDCAIRDGVLILRGRVSSYYLKQVAQTTVRSHLVPAMVIDNQILVDR